MTGAAGDDNQVVITGAVCNPPETRHSPAGIPLTRFTVEHHSRREIAGIPRELRFRIVVVAAGQALSRRAERLLADDRVRITGYLSRSDYRKDERHVTLHAETLTQLKTDTQT